MGKYNHKELYLKGNQKSLVKWLFAAISDWSIIALSLFIAESVDHLLGYWLASLIIGTRQHALSFLGHDGAHGSISKIKWLNDGLTSLFAFWPMGIGLHGYRDFHFKHHKKVGTSEDPELIHKNNWSAPEFDLPYSDKKMMSQLIFDLCGGGFKNLLSLIRLIKPKNIIDILGPALLISLIVGTMLHLGHWKSVVTWYCSLGTSFWAVFRLRIWTEHLGAEYSLNTTHRIKANLLEKMIFLPHNSWMHYEHHESPQTGFWDLPKIRQIDYENNLPVHEISTQELRKLLSQNSNIIKDKQVA